MARRLGWGKLSVEASSSLGDEKGPLQGKTVRLVAPGLLDLLRNSTATVMSHYEVTGQVVVRLPAGTIRNFPAWTVCELTGKERVAMSERLGDLRTVSLSQKKAALTLCGGQLEAKLTAQTELETPEVAASLTELGIRATKAGDQLSLPGFLAVSPVVAQCALNLWQSAPGSPESQEPFAALKKSFQPVLDHPDLEASVCWPLCSHNHWTWLCFRRAASKDSEPNKWEAVYRDSLVKPVSDARTMQSALTRWPASSSVQP